MAIPRLRMSIVHRLRSTAAIFLALGLGLACSKGGEGAMDRSAPRPPNVLLMVADDLGVGDLAGEGDRRIRTPSLDRMADEGQRWTNFYAAASVCSPSRAAIMTGRLPVRSGLASSEHRVFFPWSKGGLPASEFTLAELFASRGHATGLIGKWHLGHRPEFLPTRHGFDEWFGIPYSNDMDKTPAARAALPYPRLGERPAPGWYAPRSEWFRIPLMRDETVLERAPDQRQLTRRFAEKAVDFIRRHRSEPFFLQVAFSMPHVPLFRSTEFEGVSAGGTYGDVIEELDAAIGKILKELDRLGLGRETLVVFTSDNGPWARFGDLGGSAGPLRGGKSTAWEGGFRVPTLFLWPGRIEPGVVSKIGSGLDFMATFASLLDAELPDAVRDGYDLSALLAGEAVEPRREMFFYLGDRLAAVRSGPFKAHFFRAEGENGRAVRLVRPLLYRLDTDPAEQNDVADAYPEVVDRIEKLRDNHLRSVEVAVDQLVRR